MVEPAEYLGVGTEPEVGKVEEGQRVVVTEVEEEMGRSLVVAVLEQLDQREAKEVLVEADRPLDIGAEQRHVVHAAGGRGGSACRRTQVGFRSRSRSAAAASRSIGHRPRSQAALAPMMFAPGGLGQAQPRRARRPPSGSATPSACGQSLPIMNVSPPTLGTSRLGIS